MYTGNGTLRKVDCHHPDVVIHLPEMILLMYLLQLCIVPHEGLRFVLLKLTAYSASPQLRMIIVQKHQIENDN